MRIRCFAIASAVSLAALVSAAPNALAQQAEAMKYCKPDVARLCAGVQMGGGRIIACLKAAQDGSQRRLAAKRPRAIAIKSKGAHAPRVKPAPNADSADLRGRVTAALPSHNGHGRLSHGPRGQPKRGGLAT